jgi:arginyl-tRNA synthetase
MEAENLSYAGPEAADLAKLVAPEEHALTVALSRYPEVVELAAENRAPQHVVHYLREIAGAFHSCYNAHKILDEDEALRGARITLALATRQVLANGLELLGVTAPTTM